MKEVEKQLITKVIPQDLEISMRLKAIENAAIFSLCIILSLLT